jgi:hypothetical protein
MQVSLNIETAGRVKKRYINVKEINISKSIRRHSYGSYFKTLMIKHAEQTNKCDMTRKYIPPQQMAKGGNDTNQNLPVLRENLLV